MIRLWWMLKPVNVVRCTAMDVAGHDPALAKPAEIPAESISGHNFARSCNYLISSRKHGQIAAHRGYSCENVEARRGRLGFPCARHDDTNSSKLRSPHSYFSALLRCSVLQSHRADSYSINQHVGLEQLLAVCQRSNRLAIFHQ